MNLIWNNKLAAIVAGASMLAAVEFSNIYVPDKVDDKLAFRIQHLIEKISSKCAKIGQQLHQDSEMQIYRNLIHFFCRCLKRTNLSRKNHSNHSVFITDTVANNVPIRMYFPSSLGVEASPIMFYYHGGAYCFGTMDMYDQILERFCTDLGIVIISVDYRLAPDNAYPIPIEDCFNSTLYVLSNMREFNLNVDFERIVLSGDSAGGNIAAILSSQFIKHGKFTPRIQALIYPPTQYFSFLTPSSIQYSNLELTSRAKFCLHHMGMKRINKFQEDFLIKNYHTLLIKDKMLKAKFEKYLSVDLIPDDFKKERFYYNNYANLNDLVYPEEVTEFEINDLDSGFVEMVRKMFNLNISPGLMNDEDLRDMPRYSLVMVCEHDTRKDEGLIYAERLRRAKASDGGEVDVKYYENGYHGVIMNGRSAVAGRMRTDLVEFVRRCLI